MAAPFKTWWNAGHNDLLRRELSLGLRWIGQMPVLLGVLFLEWLRPYGGLVHFYLLKQGLTPSMSSDPALGELLVFYLSVPIWSLASPTILIRLLLSFHVMSERMRYYLTGPGGAEFHLTRLDARDLWPAILVRPLLFGCLLITVASSFNFLGGIIDQFEFAIHPGLERLRDLIGSRFPPRVAPPKPLLDHAVSEAMGWMGQLVYLFAQTGILAVVALPKGEYWKLFLGHYGFSFAMSLWSNQVFMRMNRTQNETALLYAPIFIHALGIPLAYAALRILRSGWTEERIRRHLTG